ncbi:MAG TPA: isoprenyl transferase [Pirellulaceae bacterium]|nr:isoprenyl transferase [Pirellulaceae bacterium]HMO92666.1 isoprenyl transferase [Pirellulaceae bacterium]HMP70586.1 isoprenyl transferase [Pirellulaceae bacterium]
METVKSQWIDLDVPLDKRPKHIAVIMDGNGRWALQQQLPRIKGHQQGAVRVREVTEECARLKIGQLTLYCLSSENWKRPQNELDFLMLLLQQYLIQERGTLLDNNIRLKVIGSRERLPENVLKEMDRTVEMTDGNTGTCLCLAINYGGRSEIVEAVREIARKVQSGQIQPQQIDENLVSNHLYTAGMPDPDLLIRTAGEMRLSNYLLWQISYSELWITDRCWPEFGTSQLRQAIKDYSQRVRRFGGLAQ